MTKLALFGYFWVKILTNYCHISNQHPQICQTAKFHKKSKLPKLLTKNAVIGYLWGKVFKNIVIFEIRPSILSNGRILQKTKNAYIWE